MRLEDQNILITGGAGFVGSHLAERLVNESSCKITIMDNLSTGFRENISHLLNSEKARVSFVEEDLRNFKSCVSAVKGVDIVFHLGAQINPVRAVQDPFYDFEVNAKGTLNMLEASRRQGVEKFVFASTNVYGNPKYLPIDENHPTDLLSPYAASKLSGEAYCMVYAETFGLKTVRLRYSNIYGPGQTAKKSESGVIPIFMERCLQGKPPIIFGDGEQTRDFVYVDDVVTANLLAGQEEGIGGEVFNIGSGEETSMNDLAVLIVELTGTMDLKTIHGPPRAADFRRCRIDISKAASVLGYHPTYTLREGLRKTVAWWKKSKL